jgi:crotonobetainyl-CoA:carnitine CoA-transferase CaiB-like acyl-CoA transferase
LAPAVKYRPNHGEVHAFREEMAAPPLLGQHTVQILESLGYDQDTIRALEQQGVVQCHRS